MARHPTCKCGHSFTSHVVNYSTTEPDECMTGWPFKPRGTCKCSKFRPRTRRKPR